MNKLSMRKSNKEIPKIERFKDVKTSSAIVDDKRSYRNRRKQDRFQPFEHSTGVISCENQADTFDFEILDVGSQNCSIRTLAPLQNGTIVTLKIRVFSCDFTCQGTVINVLGDNDLKRFGILFRQALELDKFHSLQQTQERRQEEDLYAPAMRLNSRLKTWKEDEVYHLFRKEFPNDLVSVVDFTSNDYLGFSRTPSILNAAIAGLKNSGLGTAGPAIFSGNLQYHELLAKEVANLKKMESCLLCPSGFTANSGLFTGILMGRPAIVFLDEKDHASIFHGAMSARARTKIFHHNNVSDLERKLKSYEKHIPKVICVEGVYSMDGDLAPLDKIYALAQKYNAKLWLDDAHSFGIFGKNGCGIEDHFGLRGKIDIVTGSFSKAMAGFGGFVCGRRDVIQYLEHTGREFVFTTTLPAAICAGVIEGLRILRDDGESLGTTLWKNTSRMKKSLLDAGVPIGPTSSPIIPLILKHETLTQQFAKELSQHKVLVNAVLRPAVRRNEARIRLTIRADHTTEQIDYAAEKIILIAKKMNLTSINNND